jgi:hypothetical protein
VKVAAVWEWLTANPALPREWQRQRGSTAGRPGRLREIGRCAGMLLALVTQAAWAWWLSEPDRDPRSAGSGLLVICGLYPAGCMTLAVRRLGANAGSET